MYQRYSHQLTVKAPCSSAATLAIGRAVTDGGRLTSSNRCDHAGVSRRIEQLRPDGPPPDHATTNPGGS